MGVFWGIAQALEQTQNNYSQTDKLTCGIVVCTDGLLTIGCKSSIWPTVADICRMVKHEQTAKFNTNTIFDDEEYRVFNEAGKLISLNDRGSYGIEI